MKRFVSNILLFLLPWALLVTAIEGCFFAAGCITEEFLDTDKAIQRQNEDPSVLLGLGYNEQTPYYKLQKANGVCAPVLALGSSRVMQFKAYYFASGFFNCGGAVSQSFTVYSNFLKCLTYSPKLLILGLDTWMFNPSWARIEEDPATMMPVAKTDRSLIAMVEAIRKDWMYGKWKFSDLRKYDNNIGFNGKVKDNGFMSDGSYYYGDGYRHPEQQTDYLFADTLDRIEKGYHNFEWAEHIDEDALLQLEELLRYCQNGGIQVVGFVAPFAPSVYATMLESGKYGYIQEILPACQKLFSRYGYEFYEYLDAAALGADDGYFIDGFHGGEVAYGMMIRDMVKNGSAVADYIDLARLNELLDGAYSKLTFYDPDTRPVQ